LEFTVNGAPDRLNGASASEQERLNRRYRPVLMAFFMRRSTSHADAEDMTQDLFIKLAQAGLNGVENPDAYIFQMASNLLKDRSRRDKTRGAIYANYNTLEDLERETLDPSRFLLSREQLNETIGYLAELPERTRILFILFRIEGISQNELAATYGISTRAVQKHVSKALSYIADRLKREGKI
jgi:RNA polymerase sigma factor (sigma-70 family)